MGLCTSRGMVWSAWPQIAAPLALCGLYLYTVKFLGPWFMKDRKPYDLKNTIIVYNFIQVAFSAWLFIKIYLAGWGTTYRYWRGVNPFFRVLFMSASEWLRGCNNAPISRNSFWCEPLRTDPPAMLMVTMSWWYFISKFTEFLDTFFFVLRKKNNNVSTLHVLHHGLMPLFAWEACRSVSVH